MNTRTILAISLASVFAIGLISSAAAAFTITPLDSTEVKDNKNTYQKITFSLDEEVKLNGENFGGYAVFTDGGDVIAVTTHAGFYDSPAQGDGTNLENPYIDFPGPAALCSTLTGCGPQWHTHLVKPVASAACQIAAVGQLTYEEPSATVVANHDNIKVVNVQKGTSSFTEALSGNPTDFTAGDSVVDPNPVTGSGTGVAFPLVPVFADDQDPTTLQVICIGPPTD